MNEKNKMVAKFLKQNNIIVVDDTGEEPEFKGFDLPSEKEFTIQFLEKMLSGKSSKLINELCSHLLTGLKSNKPITDLKKELRKKYSYNGIITKELDTLLNFNNQTFSKLSKLNKFAKMGFTEITWLYRKGCTIHKNIDGKTFLITDLFKDLINQTYQGVVCSCTFLPN